MVLNIRNICEDFLKYYEAARGKTFEESEKLWKELYEEPNRDILDTYLGILRIFDPNFKLESQYPYAFNRYDEQYEKIKASIKSINGDIIEKCKECKELFKVKDEEDISLTFILFVALYIADGYIIDYKGKPTAFFAVEKLYTGDTLKIFLGHEVTHNIHRQLSGIKEKCTLAENIFQEGLAVAVSEELCKGQKPAYYIYHANRRAEELTEKAQAAWGVMKEHILQDLHKVGDEHGARYFGGDTGYEDVPCRCGYAYGYSVVKRLLEEYTFEELIRWNSERVVEEVERVIELM